MNDFNAIAPNGKKATRRCRCGYLSDPARACSRAPKCAGEYQTRISGPLYDRIDQHVEVGELSAGDLALPPPKRGEDGDVGLALQPPLGIVGGFSVSEAVENQPSTSHWIPIFFRVTVHTPASNEGAGWWAR